MKYYTITGKERYSEISKRLKVARALLRWSDNDKSYLQDWEIAKSSGVNVKKIQMTLKELEEGGLITRDTITTGFASKQRTIRLHFDRIREADIVGSDLLNW